jgi:HopA1 effector protein family
MSITTLSEIIDRLEILPDDTICHPDFPPIELSTAQQERFARIPAELRAKYTLVRLQTYLYERYFTHSELNTAELAAWQPTSASSNIVDGVDLDFCQRIDRSNTSRGYLDPDWQIVANTEAGESIVVKEGLHLHIDPQVHLSPQSSPAQIGDVVSIYLPRHLVGQDCYIAIGNCGKPTTDEAIELYFNFTPDIAVEIVRELTTGLNRSSLPFQLAILHDPALFYRYDAGTLSLMRSDYLDVQPELEKLYRRYRGGFGDRLPLFTKQLAPGVGIAEVPTSGDRFGWHRCELLARGLSAARKGQTATSDKLQQIGRVFATAGIDWDRPYLNPGASDCYVVYEVE